MNSSDFTPFVHLCQIGYQTPYCMMTWLTGFTVVTRETMVTGASKEGDEEGGGCHHGGTNNNNERTKKER